MKSLLDLIGKGGPAMIAIMVLSVVLYSRCFRLLGALRHARRRLRPRGGPAVSAFELQEIRHEVLSGARGQRIPLRAMIAAAPLLGLLGTVRGMARTFEGLSADAGGKSMEELAHGISEVLVTTESGLLVALPAMLLVWFAHRETVRFTRQANALQRDLEGTAP